MLTTTLLTLVTPILVAAQPARAQLPDSLDLTAVRRIAVQHDGRWPPLDTVARDWARSVTGRESYQGRDPLLLLLACSFQPDIWQQVPLIRIANAELRRELQLSPFKTEFSYAELVGHRPLHLLIDGLSQIEPGRKPNPLESKVSDINGELIQLQQAFMGQTIKPIPDPKNPLGAWRPIAAGVQSTAPQTEAVKTAWIALGNAFRADDAAAFEKASTDFATALNSLPAAHRPAAALVNTELRYNSLRPFRTAWIISGVGALLAGVAMFVRRKSLDVIATITMVAGFGVLTYGLSLRWQIAGRIPASNMFESLLFLSWGMGAFAIIAMLVQRQRLVPLTASGMGALSLFLADSLPLDHFIRPIAPVLLDTVWMSIHVPIIMVSYSVLALAVLVAHVQVGVMAVAPGREKLIRSIDGLHYWYAHVGAILLFVGIVTGSMWAASSWGRYWGWDPKEVWSLVAFLGYMAILHVRASHEQVPRWALGVGALMLVVVFAVVVPKLAPLTGGKVLALSASAVAVVFFVVAKGRLAIAVKSILAFWMIIMTYVGVNYVLGIGLHSYGFGTGAVASRMFTIGGIDLALVGLGSAICLIRQRASIPRDVKLPLIGSMQTHAAHR